MLTNLKEELLMKMIVGISNELIERKLISSYSEKYSIFIVNTKDQIVKYLESKEEFLIVIREDLEGKITFLDLIENIKEVNPRNKVVVVIKNLTKEIKEKLFSKEVFNIIEGNSFLFEELIENIESPKMVIYKTKSIVKNKIIFITGTRNSGKTVFTKMLSECIARNKNRRVLVLDLDFIYPSLDTYLSIDYNYSLVDFFKDLINHKLKKIESYECSNKKIKNIKYILNSKSIGIPNEDVLLEMFKILKEHYDYIIVDTSTLMINKIYNLSKIINCEIIYLIEESIKALREYVLDNSFIDKNYRINTKYIVNKSRGNKEILKEIRKVLLGEICLILPRYHFIEIIIKRNIKVLRFNKLLKKIGIISFENIKIRIIEKILNLKEE